MSIIPPAKRPEQAAPIVVRPVYRHDGPAVGPIHGFITALNAHQAGDELERDFRLLELAKRWRIHITFADRLPPVPEWVGGDR